MKRLALAALAMTLAACEPKPEEPALDGAAELDGAPASAPETPASLGPGATAPDAAARPVMGIAPPMGVQVIEDCEAVIAADYDKPPKMACLLFQTEDAVKGQLDAGVFVAISEAGWNQVRVQGDQYYFERPRAGTDCADVAVVSVLTDRLPAVLDHARVAKPAGEAAWQAYSIPASTHQACGADRMKP
jgi:hypothetical protein